MSLPDCNMFVILCIQLELSELSFPIVVLTNEIQTNYQPKNLAINSNLVGLVGEDTSGLRVGFSCWRLEVVTLLSWY